MINKTKVTRFTKSGLYIVAALLLILGILWITTRKPQMPVEYKNVIDSLSKTNKMLLSKQQQIDSVINIYKTEIDQIDNRVKNIKEKTTIIREYYHEVEQKANKYTPTQIDSFFKSRYNY